MYQSSPKNRKINSIGIGIDTAFHDDTFKLKPKLKTHFSNSKQSVLSKIRYKHLLLLYINWIILIHYFERTLVYRLINKCNWHKWEKWPRDSNPYHSMIYGDPQIVDDYSYPTRNKFLLKLTKLLSDNYLHRNHQIIHRLLTPDSTLFIGDLFDGGRELDNKDWFEEYIRFQKIFNPIETTKFLKQIPGNHDIGFGDLIEFDKFNRFKSIFGNANDYFNYGNHSIVLLDAISIEDENDLMINKHANDFLDGFQSDLPKILLTHVPLYRFTELQTCGPLRESKKAFPVMKGKQYQTVLNYELSQKILNVLKPKMIFSGDDHDYCHVRHDLTSADGNGEYGAGSSFSDEITVKSSAMTGGISKPAIQLISLWNPLGDEFTVVKDHEVQETGELIVEHDTFKTRLCYLPEPYQPLKHYSVFLIVCLLSIMMVSVFNKMAKRLESFMESKLKNLNSRYSHLSLDGDDDSNNKYNKAIDFLTDWKIPVEKDYIALLLNSIILIIMVLFTLWFYFNNV